MWHVLKLDTHQQYLVDQNSINTMHATDTKLVATGGRRKQTVITLAAHEQAKEMASKRGMSMTALISQLINREYQTFQADQPDKP